MLVNSTPKLSALFFGAFLTLLFFASCTPDPVAKEVPANLGNYVWAYSNTTVSKAGPIQIKLANDYPMDNGVLPAIPEDFLTLKPSVRGSYSWKGNQTILFTPDNWLAPSRNYLATVNLQSLFPQIEQELRNFQFNFKTYEQNLTLGQLKVESGDEASTQTISGKITSWDVEEGDKIEQSCKIELDGESLQEVSWEHSSNGLDHYFVAKNIARVEKERNFKLSVLAPELGIKEEQVRELSLAPKGAFACLDLTYRSEKKPYLLATFSDPLDLSQELKGLVEVQGADKKLKFTRNGNELKIFWSANLTGQRSVTLHPGIRSNVGSKLTSRVVHSILMEEPKPQVRLVGNGVIIPGDNNFSFPFEAVNLKAVKVEIFKIFSNNVLQFFQNNDYNGENQLVQVGRLVNAKSIQLVNQAKASENNKWKRYALDLSDLVNDDPSAIYQIRIGFGPEDLLTPCPAAAAAAPTATFASNNYKSFWEGNYYGYRGYYNGYSWQNRDKPCHSEYYSRDKFIARNVITSTLGLIGKFTENNQCVMHLTELNSLAAVEGATLQFYDFQQQLILETKTDAAGHVNTKLDRQPFLVVATKGLQKGYLKMVAGNPLPLSRFDVAGAKVKKGLKGFIYGERGVWRPGDTLFLNFMLQQSESKLEKGTPVTCKISNASGQPVFDQVNVNPVGGIYNFAIPTGKDAPTGNWSASFSVAAATFTKSLMVETVKPNRIKVNLDLNQAGNSNYAINLKGNWLHGAPAKNLKAKVEGRQSLASFSLPKYSDYTFVDPTRKNINTETFELFDGALDEQGVKNINYRIENSKNYPGKVKLNIRTRIFEKGGDFSEDNYSQVLDPFSTYAGVATPNKGRYWNLLELNESHAFDLVSLDKDGKSQSNRNLSVGVYSVDWSWWWDQNNRNVAQFSSAKHVGAITKKEGIRTDANGQASFSFTPEFYGNYMIRVCDEESGHCSGDYFYAGNSWYGNGSEGRDGAAMLFFTTDKEQYNAGEKVTLNIPSSAGGKALISIENGSQILSSDWIDTKAGSTSYSFYCEEAMVPNVYAHITMIQSVNQPNKDIPLRMYGVLPIAIKNAKNLLEPVLKTADVYKPKEKIKIQVSEKSGRPFAYTLAVVEEGLLDLTRFKTPNPASSFLAREALGVRTWDMYNQILTYGGGSVDRLLAIGGDASINKESSAKSANRFEPVVKHLGPFYLNNKEKAQHEITMPNYVGSVRVMIVALGDEAYGHAEKAVPVRQPLMVLGTLPRTLAVGDEISLPVNVFAMEDHIKEVNITVRDANGLALANGAAAQQLYFDSVGDELAVFKFNVGQQEGPAKFIIEAKSGSTVSTQTIDVQISHPLAIETTLEEGTLPANATELVSYDLKGIPGSNEAYIEIGGVRPINLQKHLGYLLQFPHGCLEQTTSKAFAQLNLDKITDLETGAGQRLAMNMDGAIRKLQRYQRPNGGFSYWSGASQANDWATSYAGHFLLAAKERGYLVPDFLVNKWLGYQSSEAQQWRSKNNARFQAYRLYTLALADAPELGAMNRLRERKELKGLARWLLAGAYALAGQKEVAKEMVAALPLQMDPYFESSGSYGSGLRDQGMILSTLIDIGDQDLMLKSAANISNTMADNVYYNTHALGLSLFSFGKYYQNVESNGPIKIKLAEAGAAPKSISFDKPIYSQVIGGKNPGNFSLSVSNEQNAPLYYRIVKKGKPRAGEESASSNHIKLKVDYLDVAGKKLDVSRLAQGTDFIARVTVSNSNGDKRRSLENMALTQVIPPGWEITNTRMSSATKVADNQATYQDVRDDKVFTYFDLYRTKAKVFELQLSATYLGKYYLPGLHCENMYSNSYRAQLKGQWVEVVPLEEMLR